jgi:hypothetical protein
VPRRDGGGAPDGARPSVRARPEAGASHRSTRAHLRRWAIPPGGPQRRWTTTPWSPSRNPDIRKTAQAPISRPLGRQTWATPDSSKLLQLDRADSLARHPPPAPRLRTNLRSQPRWRLSPGRSRTAEAWVPHPPSACTVAMSSTRLRSRLWSLSMMASARQRWPVNPSLRIAHPYCWFMAAAHQLVGLKKPTDRQPDAGSHAAPGPRDTRARMKADLELLLASVALVANSKAVGHASRPGQVAFRVSAGSTVRSISPFASSLPTTCEVIFTSVPAWRASCTGSRCVPAPRATTHTQGTQTPRESDPMARARQRRPARHA